MIIEIAIGAGVAVATYLAIRRRSLDNIEPAQPPNDETGGPEGERTGPGLTPAGDIDPDGGVRGYRIGDVVLYLTTELWLAGVARLDETGPVMALFHAPGAERFTWVAQLKPDASAVALLRETDQVPAGRVPDSLPLGGRRYRLERRGKATIQTYGELPAPTADQTEADFVHLDTSSGHTLIVLDFLSSDTAAKRERLALIGERVDPAILELLPGGD